MNRTLHNTNDFTINPAMPTTSLFSISEVIHCSVLIFFIILGLIGNILNVFLFTSTVLFRTSSSLYLLSASIANLFVISFVLPLRLAADGFNHDITSYSSLSCRLVSYISHVLLALPPFFTVLACADRWAASCIQVNRRRFASIHTARRLIPLVIILCCLLYSYVLATFIRDPTPPPPYCSVDEKYAIFGLSFYLITYSLVPPSLMAFFSILIISNVLRKRDRVMPALQVISIATSAGIIRRRRRRLSQMQVMLVCQAITECLLTLPFSIINLASIVTENDEYFLLIYSFIRLFIFINYVSSFYIYTLSSKLYREELKKLVRRIWNHR